MVVQNYSKMLNKYIKKNQPKYFNNKMANEKRENNTYPTGSIFEFIRKLKNLMTSAVEENKKVIIDFKVPYHDDNYINVRVNNETSITRLIGIYLASSLSHEFIKNRGESKRKKLILEHMIMKIGADNIKYEKYPLMEKTIQTILINDLNDAKALCDFLLFHLTNAYNKKPVLLSFGEGKIYIKKIVGEDHVYLTWTRENAISDQSIKEYYKKSISILNKDEEKSEDDVKREHVIRFGTHNIDGYISMNDYNAFITGMHNGYNNTTTANTSTGGW